MPTTTLYSRTGEEIGEVELPEELFSAADQHGRAPPGGDCPAGRSPLGTHSTKKRGEVSGGGKKPYRQKGTVAPVRAPFGLRNSEAAA